MPLTLSPEEHARLFESHEAPGPGLDLIGAFAFRMAATALRLGVFELLHEGPQTARGAAERLGLDARGLELLMEGLRTNGYLRREEGAYAATPMAERWMTSASPQAIGDMVDFYDTLLVKLWCNLEESVRTGRPPVDYFRWLDENPATLRQFQEMLSGAAAGLADKFTEAAELPEGARRLLDLGGSHALYARAFCRRYPELEATVFDLPGALEIGREKVAGTEEEGRIGFLPGDLMEDDFGSGYDAVLLVSMVHCFLPDVNERLLRRVREALNPGGVVVIVEQLESECYPTRIREGFLRTFSLNLFHLMGGQLYTQDTIDGWLARSGFEPSCARAVGETGYTVVSARRQD